MPTFKDIARLSGVSYGTVSNVLNGRGNVSSDKVMRVLQAADQLGYVRNQGAQQLRKGSAKLLAVIRPTVKDREYASFYAGFTSYALSQGYKTVQYLHSGSEQAEADAASEARSAMAAGAAVISLCVGTSDPLRAAGFRPNEVLLCEQRPSLAYDYIGFDYLRAGREMGKRACAYGSVALISESRDCYASRLFREGFLAETARVPSCHVRCWDKEVTERMAAFGMNVLAAEPAPEAVFAPSVNNAQTLHNEQHYFFSDRQTEIYTITPLTVLPECEFIKYELNYRLLGKEAARRLIENISAAGDFTPRELILENTGFRPWNPGPAPQAGELTVLAPQSPTAAIIRNVARMYTRYTGVPVRVDTLPEEALHARLSGPGAGADIVSLPMQWLPCLGPRALTPLAQLEQQTDELRARYLPGMLERYGMADGQLYALPETPDVQMLFYRRDLFSDPVLRRLYKEETYAELRPPQTYAEFNRMARFFSRAERPSSPTLYGALPALGSPECACGEFLSRYFALTGAQDQPLTEESAARQALEETLQAARMAGNLRLSWDAAAAAFAQGEGAMAILPASLAYAVTVKDSPLRDRVGFALTPGAHPLLSGRAIGVSRGSAHPRLAYHFLRWLCGGEISTVMAMMGSLSPCRATYENFKVVSAYPWLSTTAACLEKAAVRPLPDRPGTPLDERRLTALLGQAVLSAIQGESTLEQALRQMRDVLTQNQ